MVYSIYIRRANGPWGVLDLGTFCLYLFILPPLPPREVLGPKVGRSKCGIGPWGALGTVLGFRGVRWRKYRRLCTIPWGEARRCWQLCFGFQNFSRLHFRATKGWHRIRPTNCSLGVLDNGTFCFYLFILTSFPPQKAFWTESR